MKRKSYPKSDYVWCQALLELIRFASMQKYKENSKNLGHCNPKANNDSKKSFEKNRKDNKSKLLVAELLNDLGSLLNIEKEKQAEPETETNSNSNEIIDIIQCLLKNNLKLESDHCKTNGTSEKNFNQNDNVNLNLYRKLKNPEIEKSSNSSDILDVIQNRLKNNFNLESDHCKTSRKSMQNFNEPNSVNLNLYRTPKKREIEKSSNSNEIIHVIQSILRNNFNLESENCSMNEENGEDLDDRNNVNLNSLRKQKDGKNEMDDEIFSRKSCNFNMKRGLENFLIMKEYNESGKRDQELEEENGLYNSVFHKKHQKYPMSREQYKKRKKVSVSKLTAENLRKIPTAFLEEVKDVVPEGVEEIIQKRKGQTDIDSGYIACKPRPGFKEKILLVSVEDEKDRRREIRRGGSGRLDGSDAKKSKELSDSDKKSGGISGKSDMKDLDVSEQYKRVSLALQERKKPQRTPKMRNITSITAADPQERFNNAFLEDRCRSKMKSKPDPTKTLKYRAREIKSEAQRFPEVKKNQRIADEYRSKKSTNDTQGGSLSKSGDAVSKLLDDYGCYQRTVKNNKIYGEEVRRGKVKGTSATKADTPSDTRQRKALSNIEKKVSQLQKVLQLSDESSSSEEEYTIIDRKALGLD